MWFNSSAFSLSLSLTHHHHHLRLPAPILSFPPPRLSLCVFPFPRTYYSGPISCSLECCLISGLSSALASVLVIHRSDHPPPPPSLSSANFSFHLPSICRLATPNTICHHPSALVCISSFRARSLQNRIALSRT